MRNVAHRAATAPLISVIIPARNATATLGRTLACLREQDLEEEYEVVVVDNESTDGTPELAERGGAQVVRLKPQLGPAGGRNAGAARARGDVLAFTDSDCFPEPGWLSAGLRCIEHADLVQGFVSPDRSVPMGPFDRSLWALSEDGLYVTANMFVRRELFERLSGFEALFDPQAEAPFGEDVWFGWRARRAGARTAFCPEARADHAVIARGASGYVSERRRTMLFARLVKHIPELRGEVLYARVFLSSRTAAFDLAAAGLVVAAVRRSPAPLAATIPYLATSFKKARGWGRRAPQVALVGAAADAVGFASLVQGSLRERALLL